MHGIEVSTDLEYTPRMKETKSGSVAVIGRPSAGKSTLVNTITEMKVSITAATPQTTRNAIRGIYTDSRGQLIFTDTPGYHLSEQKMNLRLQEIAVASLDDSDMVLYVVDATRKPGIEETAITTLLKRVKVPVVTVINKCDIATEAQTSAIQAFIEEELPNSEILTISAKHDTGIDELLIALYKIAPVGELLYSEDSYTDQPIEFRVAEVIREKAISGVNDELPHALYVEVADLEYNEETNEIWIRAFILVERESQKGIIVGKGGAGIKAIRVAAFREIKPMFPGKSLHLDLRVKAQAKWRKNDLILSKLLN